MTRQSVPPRQMSVMAMIRNKTMRMSNVGMGIPSTEMVAGRSSIWMKKRAATAGMIMFASISAIERSPDAKIRNLRL